MKLIATLLIAGLPALALAEAAKSGQGFLDKLAQGNLAEIEIGQLAENKGTSAEVKEFGAMMVEQHGNAMDKVRAVAKSKNVELPDKPDEKHIETMKSLQAKEGARFDAEYVGEMVKAHEKTVQLLKTEIDTGTDPETKALAQELLPTVENHLRAARALQGEDEAAVATPNE